MINLVINNIKIQAPAGSTILQACSTVGIEIPRFCYHEKLSIAGNCRMCLVEVGKSLKPVASCAMPVSNDMVVNTNTVLVKKAREGVLEFLLANHPLDCPICDQGGECDLQDQSMVFGSDRGRFYEYKRAVEDKNFGPFVKTVMTRCIHCTRCVRFSTEVAGVSILGTTGRGSHTEIGSYIQKLFYSELSGNVIDLCPVGALTSKPYAFTARSWELKSIETVDVFDPIVPSIRVDVRGPEIMRILPRLNESINEEWISDKTRFFYDGLKRQRLTLPLVKYLLFSKSSTSSVFISFSWDSVIKWMDFFFKLYVSVSSKSCSIIPVLGSSVDYLTALSLKKFFNAIGQKNFLIQQSFVNNVDFYQNFTFSRSFSSLKNFDALVLVGLNLRLESPVLNSRIRNLVVHSGLEVFTFGVPFNLTYKAHNISNSFNDVTNFLNGKHSLSTFLSSKKVLFVFGDSFFQENDFSYFLTLKNNFINKNFSFEYFSNTPSNVSAWELGIKSFSVDKVNSLRKKNNLFYIVGADNLDFTFSSDDLIVYQGHHGDRTAFKAHIILPTPVFTERSAFFPNIQGIFNRTNKVLNSVSMARIDYRILQAFYLTFFKKNKVLVNKQFLQNSFFLSKHLPSVIVPFNFSTLVKYNSSANVNIKLSVLNNSLFSSLVSNFYKTDSVSRSSLIMSSASKTFLQNNNFWRN